MKFKDAITAGLAGGLIWGVLSMGINSVTGVFSFEQPLLYNLMAFATGGAVFGVVTGALLCALWWVFPTGSVLLRAVAVSVFVWVVLRGGGLVLSYINPYRYHAVFAEALQGFALSILLGVILGVAVRLRHQHLSV